MQNLSDLQFNRAITRDGFQFVKKHKDYCYLKDDEAIVALKMDLRKTGSLVNLHFLIGKK